jgi:hypothetical protein
MFIAIEHCSSRMNAFSYEGDFTLEQDQTVDALMNGRTTIGINGYPVGRETAMTIKVTSLLVTAAALGGMACTVATNGSEAVGKQTQALTGACGGQFSGPEGCLNQHIRFSYSGAFANWIGLGDNLKQWTYQMYSQYDRFNFESPDVSGRFRVDSYLPGGGSSGLCLASVAGQSNLQMVGCESDCETTASCDWFFTGDPNSYTMLENDDTHYCLWSGNGGSYVASTDPLRQEECTLSPETQVWLDYATEDF